MFEFFIALFGGIYYTGKYAKEKSKIKTYEKSREDKKATYDNIKNRYAASFELEQWSKDFVASGENFEEICSWFEDDFKYVFGDEWKSKLEIPTTTVSMLSLYGRKNYPWTMPSAHVMWVYHLILARNGKIESRNIFMGYPVGGCSIKDMNVKFIERIENNLINAGVKDIRFGLELEWMYGETYRNPSDLCGGNIKIVSIASYPTHRLW